MNKALIDYEGLKMVLDHFPMGVLFTNERGEILLHNGLGPDLLGVDPLELMQRGTAALPAESGLGAILESLRGADCQKELREFESGGRKLSLSLMKGGLSLFGEPCTLIFVTDITEQRKLEEIRTSFLEEILHRIRGPLTSIKTSLSFLGSERYASLPEPIREIVALGHSEVQRLHGLVDDIWEMFALESGSARMDLYFENIDIPVLLARSLRQFRKLPIGAGRVIRIRHSDDAAPINVVADYEKLGLVLEHVINNALQYSSVDTPVDIAYAQTTGGWAEIRVTDRGAGISREDLPFIFDKFYRSKQPAVAKTESSGLGLFIARGYIELMKGELSIQSEQGVGTTVTIRLPRPASDEWPE